jgi:hypothetical protein
VAVSRLIWLFDLHHVKGVTYRGSGKSLAGSPAQSFLAASPAELVIVFYCVTSLESVTFPGLFGCNSSSAQFVQPRANDETDRGDWVFLYRPDFITNEILCYCRT